MRSPAPTPSRDEPVARIGAAETTAARHGSPFPRLITGALLALLAACNGAPIPADAGASPPDAAGPTMSGLPPGCAAVSQNFCLMDPAAYTCQDSVGVAALEKTHQCHLAFTSDPDAGASMQILCCNF